MKNKKQINYLSLLMLSLFVSTQIMSMDITQTSSQTQRAFVIKPITLKPIKTIGFKRPNKNNKRNLTTFNQDNKNQQKSNGKFVKIRRISPVIIAIPKNSLSQTSDKNSSPSLNQKVSNGAYAPSSLLVENLGCQPVETTFSVSSESTPSTPAPVNLDSTKTTAISKEAANEFFMRFKTPQDVIKTLLKKLPNQSQTLLERSVSTHNTYVLKAGVERALTLLQDQTTSKTESLTFACGELIPELFKLLPCVKNDSSLVNFIINAIQECDQI
ncbi:TPA: hypothetical protein DDZ86_03455 [Candidatus Dependentiae bacterium]|nr:hypothetical protein [Candidatus Dependentiae bacterium]